MQDDGVEAAVHNAIAHRAYQLWKRRGRPLGSPEVDWLRAEWEFKHWEAVHNAIAHRAYQLWKRRGHPLGSPEVDWLRAEQELKHWEAAYALPFATLPMEHETW
jgi:hypothetical protein